MTRRVMAHAAATDAGSERAATLPPPPGGAERKALLLLVLSAVCFGLMAFAAKLAAAREVGGAQLAAVRFAIGLVPVLLLPALRRRAFTWQRRDLLLYRGLFGGTAVLLYFLTLEHVAVGLATLLNYTAPVFSVLFAARFIGEPVRARVLPPLAVALAGVVLVVRGHAGPGELAVVGPWAVVGLASAALSGAAVTAIRAARRTEGSWAVYTSFNGIGLLVTAPWAIAQWHDPGLAGWVELTVVGLASMAAQLLMTYAYRWVENLRAGVIALLTVVVAMGLGAAFLGEQLTAVTLFGSALTLAGVLAVVVGRPGPSAWRIFGSFRS